ncbi:anti-sigma factor RsbA family regulatory protein [Streptomyces sp. URMC 123]|uniref:anti-sigma factor RsbA family regulatory protein n=1 Tax=Streptomyces sp. URMC 123 TaxID=3423403 RepID=UPI003F1D8AAB
MTGQRAALVHQACIYGSDAEFLAMAVPFIDEGLADDVPVIAVTTAHNIALLRATVADCASVEFIENTGWYRAPGRTTIDFHHRIREHPGPGRIRVLGEVVWQGREPRRVREWKDYEALANITFAEAAAWIVCPYDSRVLPDDVVADARRTHPSCLEGRRTRASEEYLGPAAFAVPRPPVLPARRPDAILPLTRDLSAVRRFVETWTTARAGAAGADRATELSAAVSEAAGHLAESGDGRVRLRLWVDAETLSCEVRAPEARLPGAHPGCLPPAVDPVPGDGLWLARYLCSSVTVYADAEGSTAFLEMAPVAG